ncbi:MAG: MFS transporter [Clostridia bacterium]|nr:MFS transporter [Clostridia bacterium]
MKTKLSGKFWCALVLFSFMGQVAWTVENMYLNVFIYKMFHASASQISAMVAASAVAATLTTVFVGALSDKIGKRKLFICGGYILWGISILCFSFIRLDWLAPFVPATISAATLGVGLVITFDCLMTFFGSSANDAAFNAWLTDSTDETNRGAAEGINAMMPLVSILAVFGGFMAFDLDKASSWTLIFVIIGVVVLVVGALGFFIIKDAPVKKSEDGYMRTVLHGFLPSTVKRNPALYLCLLCFVLFHISIQIFMPYLIIYYEASLGMADYVFIMAPAVILASVVTALWGRVYDKKGYPFSVFISLFSLCLGYVLLATTQTKLPVFFGSLFMMCGFLSASAVFGARIRDLTPKGEAGRLQGIRIFSQVLFPGIIGPYIGKTVLADAEVIVNSDGTTSFLPNQSIFVAALIVALLAALTTFLVIFFKDRGQHTHKTLKTPFEEDTSSSWEDYPRPQMKRESYLSLCGEWSLFVQNENEKAFVGQIRVPFPPESRLSGIACTLGKKEKYIYKRAFSLPENFNRGKILLHFGAVDQKARVLVNGTPVGSHIGGYLPFSLDITAAIHEGENTLSVEVEDRLDTDLPYGKQSRKSSGMWYTAISGIWQPVWLESVPSQYIESLKITPSLSSVTIKTVGGKSAKTLILHTEDGEEHFAYEGDTITLSPKVLHSWTPEDPYLYTFTLSDGEDTVESYFALRTVDIKRVKDRSYICLNGEPFFFHGLLDQGYYSDGIYLPATPKGYLCDILKMKECGFNTLRKHIKIEPAVFYYYCDKYGMLVFQDMVNSGPYHFGIDTLLPTLGIQKGFSHKPTKSRRAFFEQHNRETVALLYNHPSVVYYTIFNEGWGQYEADRIYSELKAQDPTRVWDATSGWFKESQSDVESKHVYFKKVKLKKSDKPLVLSEFGGYSYKIPAHSFRISKTYGYKFLKTEELFRKATRALYEEQIVPAVREGLCATVLTQVSDVEEETNGLFTYDRQILKVSPEEMREIAQALQTAFQDGLK